MINISYETIPTFIKNIEFDFSFSELQVHNRSIIFITNLLLSITIKTAYL